MKLSYFCMAAILLTGCVTTSYWYKPDMTEQEFNADRYQCDRDTRMADQSFTRRRYGTSGPWASLDNLGATIGERQARENFFDECLKAKGYKEVEE